VLPWFDLIENADALVERAMAADGEVPGLGIDQLVDYLTFLGRPREAAAIARRWSARWAATKPYAQARLDAVLGKQDERAQRPDLDQRVERIRRATAKYIGRPKTT
jgi:hypothetical protein